MRLEILTKDAGLKLFSLLVALLVWFHATTEKTYVHEIKVKLSYRGLPKNLFVLNELPTEAVARVRGRGKDLLLLSLMKLKAVIDLKKVRPGRNYLKLTPEKISAPYQGRFTIQGVKPEKIEAIIDKLERRRVKVRIAIKGEPARGYAYLGSTYSGKVYLYGPSQIIRDYREVRTEEIDISGKKKSFEKKVRLVPPYKDSWLKPDSVLVKVRIVPIKEQTLEGIRLKYVPPRKGKVILSTKTLKVKVKGPSEKLKNLKPTDIKAILNLKNFEKGKYKLKPVFTLPQGIELVEWEPEKIELEIR